MYGYCFNFMCKYKIKKIILSERDVKDTDPGAILYLFRLNKQVLMLWIALRGYLGSLVLREE